MSMNAATAVTGRALLRRPVSHRVTRSRLGRARRRAHQARGRIERAECADAETEPPAPPDPDSYSAVGISGRSTDVISIVAAILGLGSIRTW